MRRAILGGLVVALLMIVGSTMAGAQQPSQDGDRRAEQLRSHDEMHGRMAEDWDEMPQWMDDWDQMPMNGGPGHVGEDEWLEFHNDMHQWMTNNWDDMPMYGEQSDGWMDPSGDGGTGRCHGADRAPELDVRVG